MTRRAAVAVAVALLGLGIAAVVAGAARDEGGPAAAGPAWVRSTVPADLAARDHLLGWTGEEVLVVGGTDDEQSGFGGGPEPTYSRTGAAFDPVTGEWRPIAEAPAEVGGTRRTAVVSDDRLVLVTAAGAWWQYDASEDTWSTVPPPPHVAPGVQLVEGDGRVYVLAGAAPDQDAVDVLDVAGGTWSTLPLREDPGGIVSGELVATDGGVAIIGSRAPGVGPHDRLRADVFDGTGWRRTDGPRVWGLGPWHWTGERLVMPMPLLDRETRQPGLAIDPGTLAWTELPEGPWYEDGGWDVRAASGTRAYLSGYVYDDADGRWTEVPLPADGGSRVDGPLPGVAAGDRVVVVGEGSAWVSAP